MSLGGGPRDAQETFGRACQIGHTVLRSTTAPTDALSSHQHSRKRVPEPDRRRALELLAASRDACTEALMIAHGFTIEQIVFVLLHSGRTHARGLDTSFVDNSLARQNQISGAQHGTT